MSRPRARVRGLLFVGIALGVVIAVVTLAAVTRPVGPQARGADFSTVNRVTGDLDDWIAAVCVPQVSVPPIGLDLPESSYWTVCQARIQSGDKFVNPILFARFPSEDPMQIDLDANGIEWYAFAVDNGELVSFATRSSPSDPNAKLRASPLLQPLKRFGFRIYGSPGVSQNLCGHFRC